ncbi:MAG: hypothetical protein D5R96_08390 [Methanocalculus sp. MSAO_Arc2]|uniref:hypothetical protein n=1 Tax=Methanocalculus sp. MSAO_Arc2 TaxID=2293855 RepID=UPI000FF35A8B|nr:MAG: hypothetical protein D5R96_08390 [Methanocalculus sp. MSAO_Arc2]
MKAKPPRIDVAAIIYIASSPELEETAGRYFEDKRQVQPSRICLDPVVWEKFRAISMELPGITI